MVGEFFFSARNWTVCLKLLTHQTDTKQLHSPRTRPKKLQVNTPERLQSAANELVRYAPEWYKTCCYKYIRFNNIATSNCEKISDVPHWRAVTDSTCWISQKAILSHWWLWKFPNRLSMRAISLQKLFEDAHLWSKCEFPFYITAHFNGELELCWFTKTVNASGLQLFFQRSHQGYYFFYYSMWYSIWSTDKKFTGLTAL